MGKLQSFRQKASGLKWRLGIYPEVHTDLESYENGTVYQREKE